MNKERESILRKLSMLDSIVSHCKANMPSINPWFEWRHKDAIMQIKNSKMSYFYSLHNYLKEGKFLPSFFWLLHVVEDVELITRTC